MTRGTEQAIERWIYNFGAHTSVDKVAERMNSSRANGREAIIYAVAYEKLKAHVHDAMQLTYLAKVLSTIVASPLSFTSTDVHRSVAAAFVTLPVTFDNTVAMLENHTLICDIVRAVRVNRLSSGE